MTVKKIMDNIYDYIYPPRCPVCDGVLFDKDMPERPMVCSGCMGKIRFISQPTCMRCGKPMDGEMEELCHDCANKKFDYQRGVAAFCYSKEMKRSMYGFKYNNRREYGKYYAKMIYEANGNVIQSWNADVLIPVPLHPKRQRKRGYNQALVLAKCLNEYLGIPVDEGALSRIKNTVPQKELATKERNNNIEKAFQTGANVIKYRKVILVDDIYTTGATINECAKVLRASGVDEVYFITACIGNGF